MASRPHSSLQRRRSRHIRCSAARDDLSRSLDPHSARVEMPLGPGTTRRHAPTDHNIVSCRHRQRIDSTLPIDIDSNSHIATSPARIRVSCVARSPTKPRRSASTCGAK